MKVGEEVFKLLKWTVKCVRVKLQETIRKWVGGVGGSNFRKVGY